MPASDIGEFVVAAPDSPTLRTPYQAGVYNATDADATAAIQNAIDDLPTAGGTVRIIAGNYLLKRVTGETYCIKVERSNVRILLDAGTVLKLADSQFSNEQGNVFEFGETGTSGSLENIVVWGPGVIDGNRDNQTFGGTPSGACLFFQQGINDCIYGGGLIIRNAMGAGLRINVSSGQTHLRMRIDGLTIRDCNEAFLGGGVNPFLINNLFIDTTILQDGWEPLFGANWVMTNSHIRNCKGSAVDLASNNSSLSVTNHIFVNCIFEGGTDSTGKCVEVQVQTGGSTTKNIVFTNCLFLAKNYDQGLKISGLSGTARTEAVALTNCIFDGTDTAANSNGIEIRDDVQDVTINGCQVFGFGDNGMFIHGATRRPTRITIQGGAYYNNDQDAQGGSGISVDEADDVFISGPHCYDNQSTPTQEHGVDLNDVANGLDIDVHNVHCKDNVTTGVRAGTGDGVSATDNYGQA